MMSCMNGTMLPAFNSFEDETHSQDLFPAQREEHHFQFLWGWNLGTGNGMTLYFSTFNSFEDETDRYRRGKTWGLNSLSIPLRMKHVYFRTSRNRQNVYNLSIPLRMKPMTNLSWNSYSVIPFQFLWGWNARALSIRTWGWTYGFQFLWGWNRSEDDQGDLHRVLGLSIPLRMKHDQEPDIFRIETLTFNSFEDETLSLMVYWKGGLTYMLSIPLRMKHTGYRPPPISVFNKTFNSFEDETW